MHRQQKQDMASKYTSALKDVYVTVTNRSTATGLILGAGLYYAISNKKYTHVPLVTVMPNVYAGYHGLKCISELTQTLNDALNTLEEDLKKQSKRK